RAVRAGRILANHWVMLKENPGRHEFPIHFELNEEWQTSELIEPAPVKFIMMDKAVKMDAVAHRATRGVLSEKDLIEEDATIFQYRVEVGGRGSGQSYRRWLAESSHYSSVFSFLSQYMSDDEAFELLPPFVRASFWTTRPLESFAALLGTALLTGPDFFRVPASEESGMDEIYLRGILHERFPDADTSSTDPQIATIQDTQGVITTEQFGTL